MSAIPRTALFKTESSRRQMLEIPASMEKHAGKTRKWSRAAKNNSCDWLRQQERTLGEIWGGKYRPVIGFSASDTCWLLSRHLERYICSLYSILMFSLLTNFGMFTSSVESTRSYVHHASLCSIRKCKANSCSIAFALYLCSAKTHQFQSPTQTQWREEHFHWLFILKSLKGAPFWSLYP